MDKHFNAYKGKHLNQADTVQEFKKYGEKKKKSIEI